MQRLNIHRFFCSGSFRHFRSEHAGMTLVDILTAVTLTALLSVLLFTGFLYSLKYLRQSDSHENAVRDAINQLHTDSAALQNGALQFTVNGTPVTIPIKYRVGIGSSSATEDMIYLIEFENQ